MMLAMLGMAVGTGNIWRFPRVAAKNGGGEFLVAWLVFLFLWSIPLILLEFGLGRKTRAGPMRAFLQLLGPRWVWMGAFCVVAASAILCYYSVVSGWTLRYAVAAMLGEIPEASPGTFWTQFTTSSWPVLTHAVMIGLGALVVARGVRAIERAAMILMPTLLIIVAVITVRALFLPGASDGIAFLFTVDWERLSDARIWIEALTQNAWDTGAGWGLVLCYAAYLREREDTSLNAFLLPIANNLISLVAGVMVFSTVFAVVPQLMEDAANDPQLLAGLGKLGDEVAAGASFSPELLQRTIFDEGSAGITFTWMPQLFKTIPFGQFFLFLFFLALSLAAFTSLVALIEVATRALIDAGLTRGRAIFIVAVGAFLLGVPSALSMRVLDNQDWVWGVALILAGLFFAVSVILHGVRQFRESELNHENSNIRVGRWWDIVILVVVPCEAVFLIIWWLGQSSVANPDGWLRPFDPENVTNVGTVLAQFGVVFAALLLSNRWLARKVSGPENTPTPSNGPNGTEAGGEISSEPSE
jgi:NSS family neurotransmitter:Na+ symporter